MEKVQLRGRQHGPNVAKLQRAIEDSHDQLVAALNDMRDEAIPPALRLSDALATKVKELGDKLQEQQTRITEYISWRNQQLEDWSYKRQQLETALNQLQAGQGHDQVMIKQIDENTKLRRAMRDSDEKLKESEKWRLSLRGDMENVSRHKSQAVRQKHTAEAKINVLMESLSAKSQQKLRDVWKVNGL